MNPREPGMGIGTISSYTRCWHAGTFIELLADPAGMAFAAAICEGARLVVLTSCHIQGH